MKKIFNKANGVPHNASTEMAKVRLKRLGNMTPGDFEQVIRRAKLAPAKCPTEFLQQLESALLLKKSGVTGAIGFLAAA